MLLNIPPASAPYARRMLTLLCCSKRPLTVPELVDAVAVEVVDDTPRYNPKCRLEDLNAIQEVCPGFTELSVDQKTKEHIIQIAHFSVQEYLESGRLRENDELRSFDIKRTNAHAQMAHICLIFFLEPTLAFFVEDHPFMLYAAEYWPHHFLESSADPSVEVQVFHLFEGRPCLLKNWARVWNATKAWSPKVVMRGEMLSYSPSLPIYLASCLGLQSLLRNLLDRLYPGQVSTDPNAVQHAAATVLNEGVMELGQLPLPWSILNVAVERDYLEVARLLLERGAHPDSESLKLAIANRSLEMMKLVIKHGYDVFKGEWDWLRIASYDGAREIVEALLDLGLTPNPHESDFSRQPLMYAAKFGHKDVAKLLLERGAIVDSPKRIRAAVLRSAMDSPIKISRSFLSFLSEEARDVDARNMTGPSLLLETPMADDSETAQRLFMEFAALNPASETMATALQAALHTPWAEDTIKMVLKHKVPVDDITLMRISEEAFRLGKQDIAHLLVEQRRGFLRSSTFSGAVLHKAVNKGSEDLTKFVLAQGAEVNSQDNHGQPALFIAAQHGQSGLAHVLLKGGADVDSLDKKGRAPLSYAAEWGKHEMVQLLLREGADINSLDESGRTPLSYASEKHKHETVQLLLKAGADVNCGNKSGETPLYFAASRGDHKIVQMLLEKGATMITPDQWKQSTLCVQDRDGFDSIAKLLPPECQDINSSDGYGWTLLHEACSSGFLSSARKFLDKGASPAMTDNLGRTPLFIAARAGHLALVQLLLERDPSLKDQKDCYGMGPLSAAIMRGHAFVLDVLLDARPDDIECRDTMGRNSLWWARRQGYADIVDILLDEGQRRGLSFEDRYSDAYVPDLYPAYVKWGGIKCDVCCFVNVAVFYCSVCNTRPLYICKECFDRGGRCIDDAHLLQKLEHNPPMSSDTFEHAWSKDVYPDLTF